ncbi:histidine kinase [Streptomyces sp. NPDC007088]|uniref:histidine kinase n=1 Tax=Streptomyces sp. NPDC007088 TaxID=3364773 RepID=UPI0036BB6F3C
MLIEVVAAAVAAGGATAAATGGPLVAARRRARQAEEVSRSALAARERAEAESVAVREHFADEAAAIRAQAAGELAAVRTRAEQDTAAARELRERVESETEHLLARRLPALLAHLRTPHVVVPGLQNPRLAGTLTERQHSALLDAVAEAVAEEGERVDEAGRAVVRGAMSRVHSLQLRLQDGLSEIQTRHADADPGLMADILALDMLNELVGRAAQTPALAAGSTPMLFRDDTHLTDVVVSAASRVKDFKQRIGEPANHLGRAVGVMAQCVEPLRSVLAELLANAVYFSHGTLKVDVALHETQTGVSIVIEDAGVGLNEDQFARAERLLSGDRPVRLVELGDPPQTGWAAIGSLVRQFGFQVSLKKSSYGGVAAVVAVPTALLVEMPDSVAPSVHAPQPVRRPAPAPAEPVRRTVPPVPGGAPQDPAEGEGPTSLPRRRRKSRERGGAPARVFPVAELPRLDPQEAEARWGGWQAGRRKGQEAVERTLHTPLPARPEEESAALRATGGPEAPRPQDPQDTHQTVEHERGTDL